MAHIVGVSCVEEPSVFRVVVIYRWGVQHALAECFVPRPVACSSCLLLGCRCHDADIVVFFASSPGSTFVECCGLIRYCLVQFIQIDVRQKRAEVSSLGRSEEHTSELQSPD